MEGRRPLGVQLARRAAGVRAARLAMGPTARAPAPRRAPNRVARYVQFGNGSWKCFDIAVDPTWRTEVTEPAVVLPLAQAMSAWRSTHAERTWTSLHLGSERLGRWPQHLVADQTA